MQNSHHTIKKKRKLGKIYTKGEKMKLKAVLSTRLSVDEHVKLKELSCRYKKSKNAVIRGLIWRASEIPHDEEDTLELPKKLHGRFRRDKFRTYRIGLGLSYADVGEAIGVTGSAVAKWEDGTRLPTKENVTVLKAFLREQLVQED